MRSNESNNQATNLAGRAVPPFRRWSGNPCGPARRVPFGSHYLAETVDDTPRSSVRHLPAASTLNGKREMARAVGTSCERSSAHTFIWRTYTHLHMYSLSSNRRSAHIAWRIDRYVGAAHPRVEAALAQHSARHGFSHPHIRKWLRWPRLPQAVPLQPTSECEDTYPLEAANSLRDSLA